MKLFNLTFDSTSRNDVVRASLYAKSNSVNEYCIQRDLNCIKPKMFDFIELYVRYFAFWNKFLDADNYPPFIMLLIAFLYNLAVMFCFKPFIYESYNSDSLLMIYLANTIGVICVEFAFLVHLLNIRSLVKQALHLKSMGFDIASADEE